MAAEPESRIVDTIAGAILLVLAAIVIGCGSKDSSP